MPDKHFKCKIGKREDAFLTNSLLDSRPAKTGPFVINDCLTPDDFTPQLGIRTPGWERVKIQSLYAQNVTKTVKTTEN